MNNKFTNTIYMVSKLSFQVLAILFITLDLALANETIAQVKSIKEVTISLNLTDARLADVLEEIERKTNYRFSLSSSKIDLSITSNINVENATVEDVLMELSKVMGLQFGQVNNSISVSKRKRKADAPRVSVAINQGPTIKGVITDENGSGLPGTTIQEKGTSNGTITDVEGNYTLTVGDNDAVLVISFVGYVPMEVPVDGRTTIDLSLKPDVESLQEVVVVGYGTQKKETVTGAVSALKGKDIVKSPAVDMSNSLAGRLPGLVVIQTSGEPGNDGARINIRGINTLGNSSPLVVIDGIPDRDGGLGRLSPLDIESISILKDASAAIYGARAANGVILITTKRGASGKPIIDYSFNQGWAQPTVVPEMANAVEYATIMNEISIFSSVTDPGEWADAWDAIMTTGEYTSPLSSAEAGKTTFARYSPEAIRLHGEGSDPWGYPDTDWFGDAFKTWSPQSRHNLSIRGGNDDFKYFTSVGFVDQDAYYKNSATRYKQYNLRVNLDANINEYIKTKVGVMARREDRNYPTESAGAIFRMLMRGRPTEPEVWPNGKPGPDIENGQNPYVITTNATGYVDNPQDLIQVNGSVDLTNPWVEGLKLTLSAAIDKNNNFIKEWQTPWELYYWDRVSYESDGVTPLLEPAVRSNFTDPRLTQGMGTTLNTNYTAMLNYDKSFGDHTINLLAGVTREKFSGNFFYAFRRNFISPAVDQLFVGGTENQDNGGTAYERPRMGYYGRAQYNYKEKYLAEFIWRYDGSYIFPEEGRFGFFPGFLVGWNVSNEDWFNVPGLDYLKVRASYGQMGNDQVFFQGALQEFAYLSTYSFGEYPINSQVQATLFEQVIANPNFTWERANNWNGGIDATLFGRLDFSLEYFYNYRSQILIQETGSTPSSSGIVDILPPQNKGEVKNSGMEFDVRYSGQRGDLTYNFGVNGGYARNEVIFMDEVPGNPEYQHQEGKPIGAYLVYEADGVFRDEEAISANTLDYSAVTGQLRPGDMKFVDQNGDGIIDADDQKRIDQNATPTFNFGATANIYYKNFDFSLLFQGATGAAIRVQTESGDIGNFLKYHFDNRWSIDNPSSEHPRLASRGDTYYTGGAFGNNTYWLFSKNYIRLKNIEIGYSLPKSAIESIGLGTVRFYVNALNLLTLDKHNIFDPESENQAGTYYPQARVINSGVTISF